MRRWIANKLAGLARRIYPQSEEVMSFYYDRMMEAVITGQSTIKVSAVPMEEFRPTVSVGTLAKGTRFHGDGGSA